MKVTKDGFKDRQLHIEDYLQMVSAEQKEYAEMFDYGYPYDFSYILCVLK